MKRPSAIDVGLWLILATAGGFFLYSVLGRVCAALKSGVARTCMPDQLWVWVAQEGGWWKLLIALVLIGFVLLGLWDKKPADDDPSDSTDP